MSAPTAIMSIVLSVKSAVNHFTIQKRIGAKKLKSFFVTVVLKKGMKNNWLREQ